MESFYYVWLDVHNATISYCLKTAAGEKVAAGSVAATRSALSEWAEALPGPWGRPSGAPDRFEIVA